MSPESRGTRCVLCPVLLCRKDSLNWVISVVFATKGGFYALCGAFSGRVKFPNGPQQGAP